MGVPSFFKWLTEKYPHVLRPVEEDIPKELDGVIIPIDLTQSNPNNVEFDNLYLDLNGIIHPCCHPEDEPEPETEDEMIRNIFEVIDRVFAAVRPRKLLYMAIDGPAPRAKMNQQRSRRFRTAMEAKKAKEVEEQLRREMLGAGKSVPQGEVSKAKWDSNVITPGTEFMDKVAKAIRFYVHERMNNDKAWQNIKVIVSDSNVPGEGEHKVIEYIRLQRLQSGYDPNTHHVIHGLDADLIMLALATHEPRFTILRERVFQGGNKVDKSKKERGASIYEYQPMDFLDVGILREYLQREFCNVGLERALGANYDFERAIDDFIFLCFFVGNDFLPHLPSLEIREGAIDLLIRLYTETRPRMDGWIADAGDVNLKRCQLLLRELGKYEDQILQNRAQKQRRSDQRRKRDESMRKERERVIRHPDQVVALGGPAPGHKRKHEELERDNQDAARRLRQELAQKPEETVAEKPPAVAAAAETKEEEKAAAEETAAQPETETATSATVETPATPAEEAEEPSPKKRKLEDGEAVPVPQTNGEVEVAPLRETEQLDTSAAAPLVFDREDDVTTPATTPKTDEEDADIEALGHHPHGEFEKTLAERIKENSVVDQVQHPDNVRLGEHGYRNRYYSEKFGVNYDPSTSECQRIFRSYLEGLVWVMNYYYKGCRSWDWYYPYHYAPVASDLVHVAHLGEVRFPADKAGQPFQPFEQLMAVLPPASAHALPLAYRTLMTDSKSPLRDFYPESFKIDLNGKKFSWQGVAILPFIDAERLHAETRKAAETLTEEEAYRNSFRDHVLIAHDSQPVAPLIMSTYLDADNDSADAPVENNNDDNVADGSSKKQSAREKLDMKKHGIAGEISRYDDHIPLDESRECTCVAGLRIENNRTLSVCYYIPPYVRAYAKLLPNVKLPEPKLPELEKGSRPGTNTDYFERFMRGFHSDNVYERGSFQSGFDQRSRGSGSYDRGYSPRDRQHGKQSSQSSSYHGGYDQRPYESHRQQYGGGQNDRYAPYSSNQQQGQQQRSHHYGRDRGHLQHHGGSNRQPYQQHGGAHQQSSYQYQHMQQQQYQQQQQQPQQPQMPYGAYPMATYQQPQQPYGAYPNMPQQPQQMHSYPQYGAMPGQPLAQVPAVAGMGLAQQPSGLIPAGLIPPQTAALLSQPFGAANAAGAYVPQPYVQPQQLQPQQQQQFMHGAWPQQQQVQGTAQYPASAQAPQQQNQPPQYYQQYQPK